MATRRRKPARRPFGKLVPMRSGKLQASYMGPDGLRHTAPGTFDTYNDGDMWLADRRREITKGEWAPPTERVKPQLFGEYADDWWSRHEVAPRTKDGNRDILDHHILPTFVGVPVRHIDSAAIKAWYYNKLSPDTPTMRAHSYSLMRQILWEAVDDELLPTNPCHIKGASSAKKKHETRPATQEQLKIIVESMPRRYGTMALVAGWSALRFGELTELRRRDIDLDNMIIHVERAVYRIKKRFVVGLPLPVDAADEQEAIRVSGPPKTDAGVRDVDIPAKLIPRIREHLASIPWHPEALLFPAAKDNTNYLAPSTLYKVYYPAREKAERPDLRFHDLRHTGAVFAAATGAPLVDIQSRLGHSTPNAAMRYQHAVGEQGRAIARGLSDMMIEFN